MLATWRPADGEVLRLSAQGDSVVAVLGQVRLLPLALTEEGLQPLAVASILAVPAQALAPAVSEAPAQGPAPVPSASPATPSVAPRILELRPDSAVLDLGAAAGLTPGQRFEIRSQKTALGFNLDTGRDEPMPSNEVTGVVEVIQVSQDRALVRLGRGDRATRGDLLMPTNRRLEESPWFTTYQRDLHRVQFRLAPFVAVESLNVGALGQALIDYSFEFPMRVESGFRNFGLVFGEEFAAPFQFDLIPSYDTDYFEVGLGAGYSFSAHPDKRGFTFLQKIRLGTVDGLHFTMWNSFIYQDHGDDYWDWGSPAGGQVGQTCTGYEPEAGAEFAWNGFDAELGVPVSDRVALMFHGAYSQAGWGYGDVGIKTLAMGNGGPGSLFIPVSIGGGVVLDHRRSGTYLACNPATNKLESVQDYSDQAYGGPIISIGADYRW
jgi:hypothetical protein